MKRFYVKMMLLSLTLLAQGVSMSMDRVADRQVKKASKKTIQAARILEADRAKKSGRPLALPEQRPAMEGNFFTELPKELRNVCVPSYKPNREIPFMTRGVDFLRNDTWLMSRIKVSSTSRYSRLVMLRDDAELADFIRRSNGVRLEPNPTAAISKKYERGLSFKHVVEKDDNSSSDELSYGSMLYYKRAIESQPRVNCSVQ